MRPGISSKHSKRNSDEERSKKKKMKSNKRRRHDSSSSSSYSSGSEIDARSWKKSTRREAKRPERTRKQSKKRVKKKSRKARYRREASVSSSSRSCSTCRGRSSSSGRSESGSRRSRSPVRGNKRVKLRERSRSRSHPRADRKAKLRGRSRSVNPPARADRRVKSRERSRSKVRERGRSGRSSRRMSYERDGWRHRSRSRSSCDRSKSRSSRSYTESRSYSEGKGKEVDQPRRLKSALVVTKESEEVEEGFGSRDKIVRAYDDLGRSFDAYEQPSEDRQLGLGGEKRATDTWVEDGAYAKGDECVLTNLDTEPAKNADAGTYDSTRKNSDAVNAGSSESEDLELLLRQRALENFKKFRGGLLAKKSVIGDQKDESVQIEPRKDADGFAEAKYTTASPKCKSTSSLELQGSIQGGAPTIQPRIRSIVNIPTESDDGNSVIRRQNASESSRPAVNPIIISTADGQTSPNHLKNLEEPLDKVSSGKTPLAKDLQYKTVATEPGSSTTIGAELKIADESASGASACLNVESGNKPTEEDTTGSRFEQKTFSRMHDGEMVQVSYKVYIPKKSPALARRQLQR